MSLDGGTCKYFFAYAGMPFTSTYEQEVLLQDYIETKGNFQIGFIGIIPEISINIGVSDTDFPNYILFVCAYSIIPKFYGLERIITAVVLD